MDPATISLILFGLQKLIESEPALAQMIQDLFSGGIPTEADWAAVRARVAQPFETLAPNSAAQIAAAATAGTAAPPPVPPAPAGAPVSAVGLPFPTPPEAPPGAPPVINQAGGSTPTVGIFQ